MTKPARAIVLHSLAAIAGLAAALLLAGAVRAEAIPGLRPAPPAGYVAQRERHLTVYAPSEADVRDGVRELRYARGRFRALFNEEAGDLVVVLASDAAAFRGMELAQLRRRDAPLLPFVTPAHLDSRAAASAPASRVHREPSGRLSDVKPLAHEACHLYVARIAERDAPRRSDRTRGYGSSSLPDWFDEAAATLCESDEGRAQRRDAFRAGRERRIPLHEFAAMEHPLGTAEALARLGIDASPGQTGVHYIPAEQARRLFPRGTTGAFYAQAHSLGEFIAERAGPRGMRALARVLAQGRTLDQALREIRADAPALPLTVDALEAEWLRWVDRPPGH